MGSYFYNPCQPCCLACGWGPLTFRSTSEVSGFQQTNFSGTPSWSIATGSPGTLNMNGGSGSLWLATPNPDPTGTGGGLWKAGSATVQAVCWREASINQEGVFIGNGRVFYIDWTSSQYVQQACDAHGVAGGPAMQITGTPKSGDTLALCVAALKDGKFTISYSINGNVAATETEVSLPGLTTGSTFNSGFWGAQAAQFGTASLVCGTGCAPGCDICAGQQSQCWLLDAEGISLSAYNGSFCLSASACTLSDPKHTNSWAVSIGRTQSILSAGTSPNYATYALNGTFNCNGSNTFNFSSSTQGTGWPSAITVSPTDCTQYPCVNLPCHQCSWPARWTVDFTWNGSASVCSLQPGPNGLKAAGGSFLNSVLWFTPPTIPFLVCLPALTNCPTVCARSGLSMECVGADGHNPSELGGAGGFGNLYKGDPNFAADMGPAGFVFVAEMLITFPSPSGFYCQSGGPSSFVAAAWWEVRAIYAIPFAKIKCLSPITIPWVATYVAPASDAWLGSGGIGTPPIVNDGNYNMYACQWPGTVTVTPA